MDHSGNIDRMLRAVVIAKVKGAVLNTKAVVAQAALESGWWQSSLAAKWNNLFGIKAGTLWQGQTVELMTAEYVNGGYVRVPAKWRVYPSWNECLVDYSHLIQSLWWFKDSLPFADPPQGDGNHVQWIAHLVDKDVPGELAWATGPSYIAKVISCLSQLQLEGYLK